MCWFLPSILVDVGVPGAPSVEQFFRQNRWLVTMPVPLRFGLESLPAPLLLLP
jgi:hypothetical protein